MGTDSRQRPDLGDLVYLENYRVHKNRAINYRNEDIVTLPNLEIHQKEKIDKGKIYNKEVRTV